MRAGTNKAGLKEAISSGFHPYQMQGQTATRGDINEDVVLSEWRNGGETPGRCWFSTILPQSVSFTATITRPSALTQVNCRCLMALPSQRRDLWSILRANGGNIRERICIMRWAGAGIATSYLRGNPSRQQNFVAVCRRLRAAVGSSPRNPRHISISLGTRGFPP